MSEEYCCTTGAQAVHHIERAWLVLNAAHEIHNLSAAVYKNSLSVAMRSLGEAVAALQTHSIKEVVHG